MFKFIKQFTVSKNENAKSFKRETARNLDGRRLKYVTERRDGEEYVLGHEGALIKKGSQLLVLASEDVVFRAEIDTLRFNEFLSLEGVILTGADLEHGGAERCVIAYYTYYRKAD